MSKKKDASIEAVEQFEDLSLVLTGKDSPIPLSLVRTVYEPFTGINTGSIGLDWALGGKGLPRSQVTLFDGDAGSGKTTLGRMIGVNCVYSGLKTVIIDAEFRWNVEASFKAGMGLPGKDYILIQPTSQEDALSVIQYICKRNRQAPPDKRIDYLFLDSLAALVPAVEDNGTLEDQQMGVKARLFSKFFRMAMKDIALSGIAILFINQIRDNIGPYGGVARPGGKSLSFYPSILAGISNPTAEDWYYETPEDKAKKINPIGLTIRGKIRKNSIGPTAREINVPVAFQPRLAVDRAAEIVDYGKRLRVLTSKDGGPINSGYHYYQGRLLGESRDKAIVTIEEDIEVMQELEQTISRLLAES